MTVWEALILGLVQGLAEFFPVSSSGHLVMAQEMLGVRLPGIAFDIAVHVATLISVLVVYRRKVAVLIGGAFRRGEESSRSYLGKLVLATLPVVALVLAYGDEMEARFEDPLFTGTMLLVTGSFLWSTRWARALVRFRAREIFPLLFAAGVSLLAGTLVPFLAVAAVLALLFAAARFAAQGEERAEPGWGGALLMGIAQATAILPGISRSGSTVVTGMWKRIDAVAAAEFSFLMSVVAISGAAVRQLPEVAEQGFGVGMLPLTVGFLAAAVSGVVAIRLFVLLLRHQTFHHFAWYCWVVGAVFLLHLRVG